MGAPSVDVGLLRDLIRAELTGIISASGSTCGLVLDPDIVGALGMVAEPSLLKEHGVTEIYTLDASMQGILKTKCSHLIYLVRPEPKYMEQIAVDVQGHPKDTMHSIYFIPRRTVLCERRLSDLGVLGDVHIGEFHLIFLPYDDDVLTMATPTAFRDLFGEGDTSLLYSIAKGILQLESLYGAFPTLMAKGDLASETLSMFRRLKTEQEIAHQKEARGYNSTVIPTEIDNIVLMDRTTDLVTPLLSQQVYEGVLDEVFGIRNGYIHLDGMLPAPKDKSSRPKKLRLTSQDQLYREIRDLSFADLGPFLKQRANRIAQVYEERHSAESVAEIAEFMKKFKTINKEHTSLQHHINLAEHIASIRNNTPTFQRRKQTELDLVGHDMPMEKYIEECIGKMDPIEDVLSLLCLWSCIKNGIREKKMAFFIQEVVQTYGFECLMTIKRLTKAGLLRVYDAKGNWSSLRKHLALYSEKPQDADSIRVYDLYTPLSCRLLEKAMEGNRGWPAVDDRIRQIPGETVQMTSTTSSLQASKRTPVTLVIMLGGMTFSEIAAFRRLSNDPKHQQQYIIATTHILHRTSLLKELL